jgi:hypothetical protein
MVLLDTDERTMETINQTHKHFKKWREWDEKNPEFYGLLVQTAREAKGRGINRWALQAIIEIMRWNKAVDTQGDPFKVNQHFRSFYARYIMENEPDLAGFFEIRHFKDYE